MAAQIEHLGEHCKPLLGNGGPGGRLAQEGAHRLGQAVLGGPDMHPGLVGLEEIEVTLREHAVLSDLDVIASRRRRRPRSDRPGGRSTIPLPIEASTLALQDPHCLGARNVPQILRRFRLHIQPLEHLSHLLRQVGDGRAANVEDIVRRPVEEAGDLGEPWCPAGA